MRPIDWTTPSDLSPDELARALDEDHDEIDDNPELTDEQVASLRPGANVLPQELLSALPKRRPGQRGPGKKPTKVVISLRIDPTALEALKASGEGWASRVAAAVEREAAGLVAGRR